MSRPACRAPGVDPDWFFAKKGDMERIKRAKAICAGCDVRLECLEAAWRRRELCGIWGGISLGSGKQRKRLRERFG